MYASTACHRGEFSHANAMSTVQARTSLTQKKRILDRSAQKGPLTKHWWQKLLHTMLQSRA